MQPNPFLEYNELKTDITYPHYPKTRKIRVALSNEAVDQLMVIGEKYSNTDSIGGIISELLEQIALYYVVLEDPKESIDPESNISTTDCRASGYEDGLMGNPSYFIQLYGKDLSDVFQRAYLRGWFEGNYIRIKGKKDAITTMPE